MDSIFKAALDKAMADWNDLARKEKEMVVRKAQLKATIIALSALCSDLPDINALSLSDAIRLMIRSTGGGLSPIGIRDKLDEMGFDLKKFKNPLASIHTAVNRLADSGEFARLPNDEEKVEAGENLKSLPTEAFWNAVVENAVEEKNKKE
jgi:hypothetical protein